MSGPLRNDCFALPPGVNWTPERDALDALRNRLHCVTGQQILPITQAAGRILAAPVFARRAHPPFANSAVDGYGFAHASLTGTATDLPIAPGRAAAGAAFHGPLPTGHAIRILTGAPLPQGVDCIALDEDVTVTDTRLHLSGTLKPGANCRPAGEDLQTGTKILAPGRRLTPGDVATAVSTGVADVTVQKRLRVAILSTGDEVVPAGTAADPSQIYDANRPMLAAVIAAWGYDCIDMGHVADDAAAVQTALSDAAACADAILTTGGASAGDEDHVSAALRAADSLHLWRIAIKPGRPLALAMWDGTPVFGLPGNPVAAYVCTLVFARPSLAVMSGAHWFETVGQTLPAGFSKSKKPGRMEYLRARIENGAAAVFPSEGSGRVSGLSWADGLVVLPHEGAEIVPGTPVTYLPFSAFGLA